MYLKQSLNVVKKGALSSLRQFLTTESLLKMMKNVFYFILKSLPSQDILPLSWLFGLQKRQLLKSGPGSPTRTLDLDLGKPGPRKSWTLKNLDSEKLAPWNIWSLKCRWNTVGCRKMIRRPLSIISMSLEIGY